MTQVTVDQLPAEESETGFEVWRVSWTWRWSNGKEGRHSQPHNSRAAARRHVQGLLDDLAPGLSREDALTLNLRDETTQSLQTD